MSIDRIQLRLAGDDPREWVGVIQADGSVKVSEGKPGKPGRSKVIPPSAFKATSARKELVARAYTKMADGYVSLSWQLSEDGAGQEAEVGYYFSVIDAGTPAKLSKALAELSCLEDGPLVVDPIDLGTQQGWTVDVGVHVRYDPSEPGPQIKCIVPKANKLAQQFFGIVAKAGQRLDIVVNGSDDNGSSIGMADFYTPGDEIDPKLIELARALGVVSRPLHFNTITRDGQPFRAAVF